MKLMTTLFSTVLLLIAGSIAAAPLVLVKHDEQYKGYMQLPRLSEVVVAVNSMPDLYWPAARLYNISEAQLKAIESQRQQLLQQLVGLQQYYTQHNQLDLAAAAEQLQQQVSQWQLAEQLLLPLDPDRVRVKAELNPLLRAGHYLLQVAPRPTRLVVTGLAQQQSLPLLNATDATEYARLLTRLAGGSKSFLYILPAGKTPILAKTGIWNSKRQEIAAGSMIFLPFEQRLLPAEFSEINLQIVKVLQHRVVSE